MRIRVPIAVVTMLAALGLAGASRPEPLLAQSDLDAFMDKVLARRDENWKKLQQYVLDERAEFALKGPAGFPIWGDAREYTWFIREGYFIRSPLKANGVTVSDADRRKAEESYLRHLRERDKREAERAKKKAEAAGEEPPPAGAPTLDAFLAQTGQPEFVDSAYFMKFKFEQGRYALAGREPFKGGRDVLRIEYYPKQLFGIDPSDERKKRNEKAGKDDRGTQYGKMLERMMNKVALVTIWVEPSSHQIVKYVFDNVNFDFLPAAWLLRVDEVRAAMEMSQPFKEQDIWLPKNVEFAFSMTLAIGPVNARFLVDYHDFREATTAARIKKDGGAR